MKAVIIALITVVFGLMAIVDAAKLDHQGPRRDW